MQSLIRAFSFKYTWRPPSWQKRLARQSMRPLLGRNSPRPNRSRIQPRTPCRPAIHAMGLFMCPTVATGARKCANRTLVGMAKRRLFQDQHPSYLERRRDFILKKTWFCHCNCSYGEISFFSGSTPFAFLRTKAVYLEKDA